MSRLCKVKITEEQFGRLAEEASRGGCEGRTSGCGRLVQLRQPAVT